MGGASNYLLDKDIMIYFSSGDWRSFGSCSHATGISAIPAISIVKRGNSPDHWVRTIDMPDNGEYCFLLDILSISSAFIIYNGESWMPAGYHRRISIHFNLSETDKKAIDELISDYFKAGVYG